MKRYYRSDLLTILSFFVIMGCAKPAIIQCTPDPIRLPEALRTLPVNPCKYKSCWVIPAHKQASACISSDSEAEYKEHRVKAWQHLKACLAFFDE